jgi:hypothetical protein
MVLGATLRFATESVAQTTPAKIAAPATPKRSADSSAKGAGSCGQGSILIPQAFVAAVQSLSAAPGTTPAVVTSLMTCVKLTDAQVYMSTAAGALAARPPATTVPTAAPSAPTQALVPTGTGAQGLAMSAAGAAANGQSPAPAAGSGADAVKAGVVGALSMTPPGMLVNGAVAAAPLAGGAVRSLAGRFSRGESKESMTKDLASGRLVVKGLRFADGGDALADGADQSLALLVAALQDAPGNFIVHLAAESDGKTPADTALARRRLERVGARLLVSGISEARLTFLDPSKEPRADKPTKPGEARLELVRSDAKP